MTTPHLAAGHELDRAVALAMGCEPLRHLGGEPQFFVFSKPVPLVEMMMEWIDARCQWFKMRVRFPMQSIGSRPTFRFDASAPNAIDSEDVFGEGPTISEALSRLVVAVSLAAREQAENDAPKGGGSGA